MGMRSMQVTLTGVTPAIMHRDNPEFAESLAAWQQNPVNKDKQKPGDDRAPGWTWIGGVYHNGSVLGVPSDNLMTMLREGGKRVATGKRQETFMRRTQSGIGVLDPMWPILLRDGRQVPWKPVEEMLRDDSFEANKRRAQELGFELFSKRVRIGRSKHLRVRAFFAAGWSVSGQVAIMDDLITDEVLRSILDMAGTYCGLLDWRPSSPTSPGPYGRFTAEVQEVK